MGSAQFGLLISLRGKDEGKMPERGEVHWLRDLPPAASGSPLQVFLRRSTSVLSLGAALVSRRGQPARDGFKLALMLDEPLEEARWRELVADANRPLALPPEELIAALTSKSTTSDRVAALRLFAERWFGCPADAPPLTLSIPTPAPLRALYGLVKDHNVCVQNRLVGPEKLEVVDDKVTFYVENQGVCVWATEATGEDPPVYVQQNDWNAPWKREADSLSGFIIQMMIEEAVFGAPFGASGDGVEAAKLARLAKHVRPLPLAPWLSSKTRFFGSNGIIGFAFESGDAFDVWLGAKDRARLEPIEDLVEGWTNVTF